jgi:DNA/RNA-binding domain of Phe-tRNA-synthetase-like protein
MIYRVEPEIFARFPHFIRGLVVARGIDNSRLDPEAAALLDEQVGRLRAEGPAAAAHPRLAAWRQVYRDSGDDPKKHPPSVAFLVERISAGRPIKSISPVVDLFNWISLKHLVPCGGDRVDEITGDLTLGLAQGTELFSSLAKPDRLERPRPGEVIYVNRRSNQVLCRRWNWRNADFSKITGETRSLVLNLDGLTTVVEPAELIAATEALALAVLRSCQGVVSTHYLDRERPEAEILMLAA